MAARTMGCSIPSSSQTGVRTTTTYPFGPGSQRLQPAWTRIRLASPGRFTCSY